MILYLKAAHIFIELRGIILDKKRRNELIMVAVIAVFAAGYFLYMHFAPAKAGKEAVVKIDGREVLRFEIDKDGEYTAGEGEHYNIITVKDGKVNVTEASCPDKLCMYQGPVNRAGEMIICLPNKMVITIEDPESEALDGVVK